MSAMVVGFLASAVKDWHCSFLYKPLAVSLGSWNLVLHFLPFLNWFWFIGLQYIFWWYWGEHWRDQHLGHPVWQHSLHGFYNSLVCVKGLFFPPCVVREAQFGDWWMCWQESHWGIPTQVFWRFKWLVKVLNVEHSWHHNTKKSSLFLVKWRVNWCQVLFQMTVILGTLVHPDTWLVLERAWKLGQCLHLLMLRPSFLL